MGNCGVKLWWAARLNVIQSETIKDSLYIRIYLFIHQEDTRFDRRQLSLCSCTKNNILWRCLWENHTEVDSGLKGGDDIRNDVHLVETLHLNLGIKQQDNRRDWSSAREGPTRPHFANAVQ
jgi:hypothetical protein